MTDEDTSTPSEGAEKESATVGRSDGHPVRDGSRVVVVFIVLIIAVAVGMIALRLQAPAHNMGNMGTASPDDTPAGSL